MIVALSRPAAPVQIPVADWRDQEAQMERDAHRDADLIFIRRVHGDASKVLYLIRGGLLPEAHSMVEGLVHASNRRAAQMRAEGDIA